MIKYDAKFYLFKSKKEGKHEEENMHLQRNETESCKMRMLEGHGRSFMP